MIKAAYSKTETMRLLALENERPVGLVQGHYRKKRGYARFLTIGGVYGNGPLTILNGERGTYVIRCLLNALEKSAVSETREVMDYLSATRSHQRFVLMGICSGAKASFKTACCDPRVIGAVLINAGGHLHDETNDTFNYFIRNRRLKEKHMTNSTVGNN